MSDKRDSINRRSDKRSTPFRSFDLSKRDIATRTSYAKIVYFHYKKQNFGIPTNLRDDLNDTTTVEVGVIDNDIVSLNVSKSIQMPSASFDFALHPTKNWKTVLAPGDWVMIYLYNNFQEEGVPKTTKSCVLIGNIDRISRSLERGDENEDKVELKFKVSGRNFGKVFEDTDLWYDPYTQQVDGLDIALRTKGLALFGTPSQITENLVDIFLGKGGVNTDGTTPDLKPWRIPSQLAKKMKGKEPSFNGILKKEIGWSIGYKTREPFTLESNGSLWDMIKRNSNELINETYLEEVREADGTVNPTFVLKPRPIQTPFLKDLDPQTEYEVMPNQSLQELARTNYIEISPVEIKYEDLGKDDHSRMNLFWFRTPDNAQMNISHMANMGKPKSITNPVFVRESIQRHGLKRMDQLIEFCRIREGGTAATETHLFETFMLQLYDMHFANHLYDAGTISCTGVLEAELGKALVVKTGPNRKDKVYYIEGYQHEWNFITGWMTTFTVTHGQWKTKGKDIFIDLSKEDHGEHDIPLQSAYIAQTGVKR